MVTSVKFWLAILALVAIGVAGGWALSGNGGRRPKRESPQSAPPRREFPQGEAQPGRSPQPAPPQPETPEESDDIVLRLPRDRRAGEEVAVRVSVRELPPRTRIIVRLKSGAIAGSISPFGARRGRKAGVFTVPIADEAVVDGTVTLRLEVADRSSDHGRPPTAEEVEDLALALLPVTP
jgi:hypothetical protein